MVIGEYLKSKEDSDAILGKFNEVCVYCNELEAEMFDRRKQALDLIKKLKEIWLI